MSLTPLDGPDPDRPDPDEPESTSTTRLPRVPAHGWLSDTLDSAAFARAFTIATLAAVLSQFAITRMSGATTYTTILVGLCLTGAAILWRRWREVELFRLLPLTLVLLLIWLLTTSLWSRAPSETLAGWLAMAGIAFLALVIAHIRDTLQTVRALGDVLRVMLSLSLALEIFSGILIDMPIRFLGIQGNLVEAGPLQGVFGTRNMLGFIATIALITFIVEWRTAAIRPGIAVFSVVLAGSLALLSASPTVLVLLITVGLATAALAIVRHTPPAARRATQITFGSLVALGLIVAYLLRGPIIGMLNARSDFSLRATLWDVILIYVRFQPVQGWGWFGPWPSDTLPFALLNRLTSGPHASALNSYFDMLLQAGWVGLVLFAVMCATAVGRSWLVATARRSVLYAWTPLVLVALLVDSMFESFTLQGAGWLLLVLCILRAGLSRSWREGLGARTPTPGAGSPRA